MQWRRRKHGTKKQIGQAFPVLPSQQKLKAKLPKLSAFAEKGRVQQEAMERRSILEQEAYASDIGEEKLTMEEKLALLQALEKEGTTIDAPEDAPTTGFDPTPDVVPRQEPSLVEKIVNRLRESRKKGNE